MRRALGALAAAVFLTLLAACSAGPGRSDINVGTPDLAQIKASGHIEGCPAGQTTDGGLPDQTLPCLGGGSSVDLSTLKGPVVLNLWASTCGPCREEMPALEQFHQKWGAQYPIIGIDSQDTIPKIALQTAIAYQATYPLVADPGGDLQGTSLTVHGYPTTYLLTADGKVKFVASGGMKDEAEVEQKVAAALGHPL
jgi:thiol-disulfide isomerase/thioredoxin